MRKKLDLLKNALLAFAKDGGAALAYSGGVDSTLLLAVLTELRRTHDFRLAVYTMRSVFQKAEEIHDACAIARELNAVVPEVFDFDPLSLPGLGRNPANRCYLCKRAFFGEISKRASMHGIKHLLDGTNADDLHVYRPGLKALAELGVRSVLAELGIGKEEIRAIAREMNLHIAEKASAPCLATRFPYGSSLSVEKLAQVAAGEKVLRKILRGESVLRVRSCEDDARIEVVPEDFNRILENREELVSGLRTLGFRHIGLDLAGYRSGSMDEFLQR